MNNKLIVFSGVFYLVGVLGITLSAYQSFFIGLSFYHLLLSFSVLILGRKKYSAFYWFYLALAFGVGMLVEWFGVHTGILFGSYHYGNVLGPSLYGVPIIIGLNWALLSIVSVSLFASFKLNFWLEVFLGAAAMVFLDYLMEPVAMKLGFWQWKGGAVPHYNYLCWFIIAFLLQALYRKWRLNEQNNVAVALFIYLTCFFTILNFSL